MMGCMALHGVWERHYDARLLLFLLLLRFIVNVEMTGGLAFRYPHAAARAGLLLDARMHTYNVHGSRDFGVTFALVSVI